MRFYSLFIITSFFFLTIIIYLILRIRCSNPSHQKARKLSKYLKKSLSDLKTGSFELLKSSDGKEAFVFEQFSQRVNKIADVSEHYAENSIKEKIAIYKQSPKYLILRAKVIWIAKLYAFFLYFVLIFVFISCTYHIPFLRSPLFLLTSSLILFITAVLIVLRFSKLQEGFVPNSALVSKPNFYSRLNKAKGFVKLLEPKSINTAYYEPELKSKFFLVKMLIKVLLFCLILLVSYLFLYSIIKLQTFEVKAVLDLIQSSFILIALLVYVASIIKVKKQKFENFFLFFLFLSICEAFLIELNWKFVPTLFALIISALLSIISFLTYVNNRKTHERLTNRRTKKINFVIIDFFKNNVYNLIPLLFLYVDLAIFATFVFSLEFELPDLTILLLNLPNLEEWLFSKLGSVIYVFVFILSLKSIIFYLKSYSLLISRTFKARLRNVIYRIFVLILSYISIPFIFSNIGPRAYLLIFSHNLFQLFVFSIIILKKNENQITDLALNSQNEIKNYVRKIKKKDRKTRELEEFISSKVKTSEKYTQIDKKDYFLAKLGDKRAILLEEKLEKGELKKATESLKEVLKSLNYTIISKNDFNNDNSKINFLKIDCLAIKALEVSEKLKLLVIFPIITSELKGKYIVSENRVYYEPLNQNNSGKEQSRKLILNFKTKRSNLNQNAILKNLREEGAILDSINAHLKLNLIANVTNTNLFSNFTCFQSDSVHVKVIVSEILISRSKTGFFNKNLSFPYHKPSNTYFTTLTKLTPLVKYLENKYTIVESVLDDNNFVEIGLNNQELYDRNKKLLVFPSLFLFLYALLIAFLVPLIPKTFSLYNTYFYEIFGIYALLLFGGKCFIYVKFLKKKSKIVIESLTPYNHRPLKLDGKYYNYVLEFLPKTLTNQFDYEHYSFIR